jgi:hypothetical protein
MRIGSNMMIRDISKANAPRPVECGLYLYAEFSGFSEVQSL